MNFSHHCMIYIYSQHLLYIEMLNGTDETLLNGIFTVFLYQNDIFQILNYELRQIKIFL